MHFELQTSNSNDFIFKSLWKGYVQQTTSTVKQLQQIIEEQFGFRKSLTTVKATYELINEILIAHNDKLIAEGIFSDLAKAFVVIIMIFYCPNWIVME